METLAVSVTIDSLMAYKILAVLGSLGFIFYCTKSILKYLPKLPGITGRFIKDAVVGLWVERKIAFIINGLFISAGATMLACMTAYSIPFMETVKDGREVPHVLFILLIVTGVGVVATTVISTIEGMDENRRARYDRESPW